MTRQERRYKERQEAKERRKELSGHNYNIQKMKTARLAQDISRVAHVIDNDIKIISEHINDYDFNIDDSVEENNLLHPLERVLYNLHFFDSLPKENSMMSEKINEILKHIKETIENNCKDLEKNKEMIEYLNKRVKDLSLGNG